MRQQNTGSESNREP